MQSRQDKIFRVYIIKSTNHDKYYIGQTNNLVNRLLRHNRGEVLSTKAYRPWKLVYNKLFGSRSEAVQYEQYLKSLKNKIYLEKLINAAG